MGTSGAGVSVPQPYAQRVAQRVGQGAAALLSGGSGGREPTPGPAPLAPPLAALGAPRPNSRTPHPARPAAGAPPPPPFLETRASVRSLPREEGRSSSRRNAARGPLGAYAGTLGEGQGRDLGLARRGPVFPPHSVGVQTAED